MKFGLGLPTVAPSDNWRAALTLASYRTAVGFGLVAVVSLGRGVTLFDASLPRAFRVICLLYLAQAMLLMLGAVVQKPRLQGHVIAQVSVDIAAFTLLAYCSAGVVGGLGMLMIAPIAAAGVILPARTSALLAACGALAMIGQEVVRGLHLPHEQGEFVQAGILGGVYFAAAALAQWLSSRLRVSEALAADRASEVRDLAELNRRIIDRMQIGALVVDARGRIETVNQAAIDLLGHNGQLPRRTLYDLAPALAAALDEWLAGAGPRRPMLRYDGRSLLPTFSRLDSDGDAPILLFIEDARRQSEQAQQIKLASLGRLTANSAHEIRNPLGAISHAGQLLAESSQLGEEETRLLNMIHRHARRIDVIVSSVLGLSRRSNHGRASMLALTPWLAEAVADYCEAHDDPPSFVLPDGALDTQLDFDAGHLRQVLTNLWDNADRYARRAGSAPTVTMACSLSRDGDLMLDIADDGPGIDPAIADQILEPFFTTARDGTGLGLHIARELCEANGAQLFFLANAAGARFRIIFARHEDNLGLAMPGASSISTKAADE